MKELLLIYIKVYKVKKKGQLSLQRMNAVSTDSRDAYLGGIKLFAQPLSVEKHLGWLSEDPWLHHSP